MSPIEVSYVLDRRETTMTNDQIKRARQMNEAGMFKFIADYYNTTKYKLNKQLKHYENNKLNTEWTDLCWAIERAQKPRQDVKLSI